MYINSIFFVHYRFHCRCQYNFFRINTVIPKKPCPRDIASKDSQISLLVQGTYYHKYFNNTYELFNTVGDQALIINGLVTCNCFLRPTYSDPELRQDVGFNRLMVAQTQKYSGVITMVNLNIQFLIFEHKSCILTKCCDHIWSSIPTCIAVYEE